MKDALKRIDTLVTTTICPTNFLIQQPKTEEIEDLFQAAFQAQLDIRERLKAEYFSVRKEKKLELFVQRCQESVIHFADTIFHYSEQNVAPEVQKLYMSLIGVLEDFLNFIESRFGSYFNQDAKIPQCYKKFCVAEYKAMMETFLRNVKKHNIDKVLINIITQTYEGFYQENSQKEITFRRLIYLKKLLTTLIQRVTLKKERITNQDIIVLLQYFNFNHFRLCNFITEEISNQINELPANSLKIEKILWHIKESNQLQTKPQFALYPQYSNLKFLCLTWLEEELFFLQKKEQPALLKNSAPGAEKTVLETSLSVSQIAMMARLLIDEGVIKNVSYRQLFKMVANTFKTNNVDRISPESLRIKSHSLEKSTVNNVKDVLIRLVNQVNKNFRIHASIMLLNCVAQELLSVL